MGAECYDCRKRELESFFPLVSAAMGSEWWTAREVVDGISDLPFGLKEKLEQDGPGRVAKSLGRYLATHRDRKTGDFVLESWPAPSRATYWRLTSRSS